MTDNNVQKIEGTENNLGVESSYDNINWNEIDKKKLDGTTTNILLTLLNEAIEIFGNNEINNMNIIAEEKNLQLYFTTLNTVLKEQSLLKNETINLILRNIINSYSTTNNNDKKNKKQPSKKDLIIQQNIDKKLKENMDSFAKSLATNDHMPLLNKKNIESFFSIVYWSIYLLLNKKNNISLSIYLDCIISLYRSIEDSKELINEITYNEIYQLLRLLEDFLIEKIGKHKFDFLYDNSKFILESHWDKIKPKHISLSDEQKNILSLIMSMLDQIDNKLLVFFKLTPGSGKTTLAPIIAKLIGLKNILLKKRDPKYPKQILLYLCPSKIPCNDVARLCIAANVPFWIAFSNPDGSTSVRPHKSCYGDWNVRNKRTKKEQSVYLKAREESKKNGDIIKQFKFFIEETKPISEQRWDRYLDNDDFLNSDNIPPIIISNQACGCTFLDNKLLKPNVFPFWDESFADPKSESTAELFNLAGNMILVSATLPKVEEIPNIINHFKIRNNHTDDNFIRIIESNKQHISVTFINAEGYIFAPHDNVKDIDELSKFIDILNEPLVRRGYSPEVVLNICKNIDVYLPEGMKFRDKFPFLGICTHESIREYACDILKYIVKFNDQEIFNILKSIKVKKINNMDINTMFTESAIHYEPFKFLHVATSSLFNNHIENISEPFLRGSPKVSDLINKFDKEKEIVNKKIESLKKSNAKKNEYEITVLQKELDNITIQWPSEYVLNSYAHASKFNNKIKNASTVNYVTRSDIGYLDKIPEKLLFSGISIYQPESFNDLQMENFLNNKDIGKGIISNPSIVYGTNIGLSLIDIDKSFIYDGTKSIYFQLIGRVGRRGKSDTGTVIFRDNQMIDYILRKEDVNIEAVQVENNYLKLLNKI